MASDTQLGPPTMGDHNDYQRRAAAYGCPDCGGLWPDFCSCPDRDDEVAARDESNTSDG